MGNIRSWEDFIKNLWDWHPLNECWTGNIRPGDIDGVVERLGYFLFLEGKPAAGELEDGQKITYQKLTRELKKSVVLVIYGDRIYPEDPENFERNPVAYRWIRSGIIYEKKPCNGWDLIRWMCKRWFTKVDSHQLF